MCIAAILVLALMPAVQGAPAREHWAFVKPERPPLPQVSRLAWPKNSIDHFILERLEKEGLAPSPEAARTELIRRVTLDLTGLPPTPQEVDEFLIDGSPNAYEKVVNRLLVSPRFGERMAVWWLEAARYADTSGYQTDGERYMWRWRDWVIEAFNRNLPYDQFTVEQIAGDLLPAPTLDQRIATGFNRNHRGNSEGGIIPEEYAVEYVVDRVDTTATVWLGLTMGCARCHDHKYDPLTQKEFYQFYAFFNNVPEHGRAVKLGNSPPMIKAPTLPQQRQLAELDRQLQLAEGHFASLEPEIVSAQQMWERNLGEQLQARIALRPHEPTPNPSQEGSRAIETGQGPLLGGVPGWVPALWVPALPSCSEDWTITDGLSAHFTLNGHLTNSVVSTNISKWNGGGDPVFWPGRLGHAAAMDGVGFVDAGDVGGFGFMDRFSIGAWIYLQDDRGGAIVSRTGELPQSDGYSVLVVDGAVQANFVKRWLDDALRVETERKLPPRRWHHLLVTYDNSRDAAGVKIYINGVSEKLKVNLDALNQTFKNSEPFRIGSGGGPESRFHGLIDDVRVYGRVLTSKEVEIIQTAETISEIAALKPAVRTVAQQRKLRAGFLAREAPAHIQAAWTRVQRLHQEREVLWDLVPTTMVMEEMSHPRDTFVLDRGQYDRPGDKVGPGVPSVLPPFPPDAPQNRLGLAQWLVDPSHPLTARVAVNQFWQLYFGAGLVKTAEDFGRRSETPSHPPLLDWLATEFIRTGWNLKAMQKLIVMSATYRQSSRVRPELLERDPENRLLARGPRLRLPAEMIRDQALALSGLLVEQAGGPSVKPYQPEGLWKELSGIDYAPDHGAHLYRRSLYTFWKRTIPPPTMMAFDASSREACAVRQTRTTTPLQALALMNEVATVEAARVLAARMIKQGGASPERRIAWAFRLATARWPKPAELQILLEGFQDHHAHFRIDPEAARHLVETGDFPSDKSLSAPELAALTATASLILNLDETITK